ncbi:MAG: PD-(D/E)XK nuclease-like domain-containing protein [Nannocystales bacterium]
MTSNLATLQPARIAEYESDAAYHSDRQRLSGSALDLFEGNPRNFAAWRAGRFEQKTTPAMAFGSLFHCLCLEPDEVEKRYAIEPEDPDKPGKCIHRASKVYKAWRAAAEKAGKTVVTLDQMADVKPMADAMGSNPAVMELLTCKGGLNEIALHFNVEEFGRPMRAKLDRVIPDRDIIVELKTTKSAVPDEKNAWAWERLGYSRKAWLYLEAYRQVFGRNATMVHIFVETGTRYPQVSWFWTYPDSPAAQWGEIETLRVLGELQRCEEAADFRKAFEPGAPGGGRDPLPVPGPILNKIEFAMGTPELTMGGKGVEV